jgi:hypothetical protein
MILLIMESVFSVSGGNLGATSSGGDVTIEAVNSDISLADDTAVHFNVRSLSKKSLIQNQ